MTGRVYAPVRRIFVRVGRGITDSTAVCVFPWEKAILERIHGGSVEEVSIDEMCNLKGAAKVEKNRSYLRPDGVESDAALGLRDQLEAMARVDERDDPSGEPATEYARLEQKYGMDAQVDMPVVTFVYGLLNGGNFERVVKEAVAKCKEEDRARARAKPAKPVESMSKAEIKKELAAAGIDFDHRASEAVLRDMLATATA